MKKEKNNREMNDQKLQATWNTENTVDQLLVSRIEMITSQNPQADKSDIFKKQDYIQAAIIMIVCLCAVVAGAFLST